MVFQIGNTHGLQTRFKNQNALLSQDCAWCQQSYDIYKSNIARGRRFCSTKCSGQWYSNANHGEQHHRYLRVTSICNECEKPFEHVPNQKRQYCSHSCANANTPHLRGKYNPNWKGGITSKIRAIRTSKDYQIWRKAVYERDDYTCQNCEVRQNLHAHHLVMISEDISRALDISNGITFCFSCHQLQHPNINLTIQRGGKSSFCRL